MIFTHDENADIKNNSQVDVRVVEYQQGRSPIRSRPFPIPLSSVRLVHKLPDPKTGIETDKIIERLIPLPEERKAEIREEFRAGRFQSSAAKENKMRARTIPGSKEVYGYWIEIPVPNAGRIRHKNNSEMNAKEHDADTVRYEVEEETWTPTLLRAPMPGGVIDELRNKYSRFRTRHDAGYQLALDNRARRKAEYKAWAESGGGMLVTPTKEARRAEVERLVKEKGEPTLEKEVLERIGEVMAKRGIEMTGKRRKEVERNLRGGDKVVKWGAGVAVAKKEKAERPPLEGEGEGEGESEEDDVWEEEQGDEAGDVPIGEDSPSEKRPTL